MAEHFNQVQFIGVTRSRDKVLITKHEHHCNVGVDPIKKMFKEMTEMNDGQNYAFQVKDTAWHLKSMNGLIYVLITKNTYPQSIAAQCLEEVNRQFIECVPEKRWTSAKEGQLDSTTSAVLDKICTTYDNLSEVSTMHKVMGKVEVLKYQMQDNIAKALDNCVALENIEETSMALKEQAKVFETQSNTLKKKLWLKNLKMKLIIAGIAIAIITVITVIVCAQVGAFDGDDK
uniref:V-SNARE coiled-coil homology domain-containing protein n=1 Tax=Octactis speculum TaxID=3111310 RepID=A0A7S2CKE3_9STRA|mmetsp:Transcript_37020/g.50083  ORF Transcript_37020/g.50083 Transcript_37020/m.50083 type:complete len:231 (+) Transcript_37020:46-738(+)|eukprot:CAMPEP_0185766628 /NCGR_PEP_ID=MMETSP1174-20130828/38542_1 /TAXON_ID=35687 /ORGANISM="Dictyocha speculum, Strain CCMP1381" /LENGTH=230 /DNA_ID=CAMNT_0028450401 /DNA_START=21 /DNA_END=713 /DNA_ORIENTATION=+